VTRVRGRASPPARFHRLSALLVLTLACGPSRGTIGAALLQDSEKRLLVREVPPKLAAERAGVQVGDEVLLIDGRDVRQMSAEAVHAALSGDVGESVRLTLVRDGRVIRVRLDRTAPGRLRPTPSAEPSGANDRPEPAE
jgi:S1-C subfamily serine protease